MRPATTATVPPPNPNVANREDVGEVGEDRRIEAVAHRRLPRRGHPRPEAANRALCGSASTHTLRLPLTILAGSPEMRSGWNFSASYGSALICASVLHSDFQNSYSHALRRLTLATLTGGCSRHRRSIRAESSMTSSLRRLRRFVGRLVNAIKIAPSARSAEQRVCAEIVQRFCISRRHGAVGVGTFDDGSTRKARSRSSTSANSSSRMSAAADLRPADAPSVPCGNCRTRPSCAHNLVRPLRSRRQLPGVVGIDAAARASQFVVGSWMVFSARWFMFVLATMR